MTKILVVGVNTRPVVNSFKKMGFEVYSVSYYNPIDNYPDKSEYLVNDMQHGNFYSNYSEDKLLSLASSYEDLVDNYIICSGIFESENSKIPKWDTIGNTPKKINEISNKYNITKTLQNLGYKTPISKKINNKYQLEKFIEEFGEVILKPIYGCGGVGVIYINNKMLNIEFDLLNRLDVKYPLLAQEYINSESYSLSYINSTYLALNKQIISRSDFGNMYVGNITPYNPEFISKGFETQITQFSELIEILDLKGMNGFDFMVKDGQPHIIDLNPRILGTYETLELSCNYNLAKVLLGAECPKMKEVYHKRVLFANEDFVFDKDIFKKFCTNIDDYIKDLPMNGARISKNEPICTLIYPKVDKDLISDVII
ncbi:ATP-grasp domain-containing protein [Methanococcus voltae]|uniref:Putative ATP-grasp superfamily ATP-dependent carboligase n=1 Tax=Methanococcus voltae TaxID=2188 RepID=A0A8J7S650_METVO|nr:ATP-grasp domain-containing protein [Methanococcus voltae]MBP2173249.1 putative ATP-grasp superfamily ATP-dependent carboligase [Methanococcus voltae]MBP2202113.1 putative ATP-grasp superfamily ATP-dependent carboligase [Methanococcus voltae]